ncbi:MAG TPA: hypothetical protein VFM69_01225 [Pricia sp.]|nr:hypothetical protein [Pricia sp.]
MENPPKSNNLWHRFKYWIARGKDRLKRFGYNISHRDTRKKAYRTIIRFLRKNGLIVSVVFLTWQIAQERKKRNETEDEKAKVEAALAAANTRASQRSLTMDDFWRPWFEVTKYGDEWRFTGMNRAYQYRFGINRINVLGRNMYEVFERGIADEYRKNDSIAYISKDTVTVVERSPDGEYLLVVEKLASVYGSDSIVRGFTFPLRRLTRLVDSTNHMEVIEIVPDTVKNAVQDTIVKTGN